jgi:RNA polymerase sigma factor (sigma-70 family)
VTHVARAPQTEEPDSALLARIGSGDLDALGTLFERYQHHVRRFLMRLGVSTADLDDLVQLSFLEVIVASRNFDGRCSARAWLLGVAATMVRRQRRSFARMTARLGAWSRARQEGHAETPSETFEGRETETRFWDALEHLSRKKREVFVLVTLEGASGEDAAVALGVPLNTVWTRLHHARDELRHRLREEAP